jgi:signal-transduction protein with cAMP-binding, CBS, and nucleotidyltransferase domain
MRSHHVHHVLVTNEKQVVGIIRSFDRLKLVEDHRLVTKNPPDVSKQKKGERTKDEPAE